MSLAPFDVEKVIASIGETPMSTMRASSFDILTVLIERRARIGTHCDAPARVVEPLDGKAMLFRHPPCLVDRVVRDAPVGASDDVGEGRERRHQVGAAVQHGLNAVLGEENAVLDRIDAAAHSVEDPLGALGMTRAGLVETVSFGNSGRHLLGRVVGVFGIDTGCHHASGRHDLDQITARVDLLAHRLDDLVDAVGDAAHPVTVPTGHADHPPGGTDRRSGELSAVTGVAHGKLEIILAAAVAYGGNSPEQGVAGVGERPHRHLTRGKFVDGFAGAGLTTEYQVHVTVYKPRQQGGAGKIECLAGKTVELRGRGYTRDTFALDQYLVIAKLRPESVDDPGISIQLIRFVCCLRS